MNNNYQHVVYEKGQCTIAVLEAAKQKYGRDQPVMLLPVSLYRRWKIGERKDGENRKTNKIQ